MKHSKAIEVLEAMEVGAPFGPDDVAAALVELRAGVDTGLRARLQALVETYEVITAAHLQELLDETA